MGPGKEAGPKDSGLPDSGPIASWVTNYYGPTGSSLSLYDFTADASGNTYAVGHFAGTAVFGSLVLTGPPYSQAAFYICKLDPTGKIAWVATETNPTGYSSVRGIDVDSNGNLYVGGAMANGSHKFGNILADCTAKSTCAFVAKLNPAGAVQWVSVANSKNGKSAAGHIAIDSNGHVHVGGSYGPDSTFGAITLNASPGLPGQSNSDSLVAELDGSGKWLQAVTLGGPDNESIYDLDVDSAGNTYLVGCFRGTAAFGSHSLTNASPNWDLFVARLASTGVFSWATSGGGPGHDGAHGIVVDGSGNSFITGYCGGGAVMGKTTVPVSGKTDGFISKLDPNGTFLWTTALGTNDVAYGWGLALESQGTLVVTGPFSGTALFGSTQVTSNDNDVFLVRVSATGSLMTGLLAGGIFSDGSFRVALDSAGHIYTGGFYRVKAAFGQVVKTGLGDPDFFVWMLPKL